MTLGWNEAKHCVDHMTLGWNEVIICSNMRLDWNEVRHMRLLEYFPFNSYYTHRYTHIKTHVEQTHTLRMPCVYLNFNLGMLPWYSLKIKYEVFRLNIHNKRNISNWYLHYQDASLAYKPNSSFMMIINYLLFYWLKFI